jgi:16S rRNA (cytosine967-C5)-methyltransferase
MVAKARAAAFEILRKVAGADAHSADAHGDDLLRAPEIDALSAQDRALTTTLVLGTLRWQLPLDASIRPLLARPGAKLPAAIETALRLGAYQLLHLDRIPPHAAIGESVELAKRAGETHASRLVNAVLRKLAQMPRDPAREDAAAAVHAHPAWMVERWRKAYGEDVAQAICVFDQQPAGIGLRLVRPDAEAALRDAGIELAAGEFLTSARRLVRGDVVRSDAFRRGWVRIQDEGSQLVAELGGTGQRILDACAAPGGKTAILAERNPNAQITAWDISRRRLDVMRKLLAGYGERIQYEVQDTAKSALSPEYDLILCDVPCTGTGTIARNPEIRFRIDADEIQRQQKRQIEILSAALHGLAPSGRLLYSTCSLEPEENEAVIAETMARHPGFRLLAIEEEIEKLTRTHVIHDQGCAVLQQHAIRNGFLRTLPGITQCDGFFAAVLMRE